MAPFFDPTNELAFEEEETGFVNNNNGSCLRALAA